MVLEYFIDSEFGVNHFANIDERDDQIGLVDMNTTLLGVNVLWEWAPWPWVDQLDTPEVKRDIQ